MTKTKYLLSALLIAICLFIAGELQSMIANYNVTSYTRNSYNLGEIITKDDSPEEFQNLLNVFTAAANQNNIGIFISEYEGVSNFEETEHLYCAGNAAKYLEKALNGNYNYTSILTGNIYYDIDSLNKIRRFDRYVTVYFCGDEQAINNAQNHISGYLHSIDREDERSQGDTYQYIELGAFTLVFVIIMVFGISETGVRKKEFILKYVYGESKLLLLGKYCFFDVIAYGIIITIEVFAIAKLNSLLYCITHIIVFALCVLVGSFLCCLSLLVANPIEVLKGKKDKKAIISANWIVKVAVSALIVCVIAFFITFLNNSMTYIKTADFFEQHRDYSFCYMSKDEDWETMVYNHDNFVDNNYRTACDYYGICQPLLINREQYLTYGYQKEGANGYYIFANANAVDYLKTVIADLENTEITADYIIITPQNMINDDFINKSLLHINNRYDVYIDEGKELYNRDNVQIIETKRSYEVFATDNDKESEMGIYKNEPVIICTVPENQSKYAPDKMNLGSQPYYMLKINDDLKNELISKNGYTSFVQTNCKEQYDHFWRMNKLGLIYFGAFSVILIILEIIVLSFIVKLEFDLNKEEFCIKKVLGYTLLSRYGELIATTLLSSFICCAISIYVLSKLDTNTPAIAAVVISLILLILEFVIIVFNAIRLEKANIQKILKGGAL